MGERCPGAGKLVRKGPLDTGHFTPERCEECGRAFRVFGTGKLPPHVAKPVGGYYDDSCERMLAKKAEQFRAELELATTCGL